MANIGCLVRPVLRFSFALIVFLVAAGESSASPLSVDDVLVQVRTTSGGFPTLTVLASGTIPGNTIAYAFAPIIPLTHVTFSSAIPVTTGQQLALLFFTLGFPSNVNVNLVNGATDPYAGGQAVEYFPPWVTAGPLFGHPGFDDWMFRTTVDGTIDQQAGPAFLTTPRAPGTGSQASVQPFSPIGSYGQTFTVGRAGLLQGADLLLLQIDNPSPVLPVQDPPPPPVPEPASLLLLGSGLAFFAYRGKGRLVRRR